jgi:NAD(P)H-dependent flavin oxidoreductase YrpB (nitropropane dioxygenase family)
VASKETDTTHIFRTLGNTARVYKNKVAVEVVAIERRPGGAKFEDIRDLVSGARGRVVYENGDSDYGIWSAGIAMGLINGELFHPKSFLVSNILTYLIDIPTCEELMSKLEKETEEIIENMGRSVQVKAKL